MLSVPISWNLFLVKTSGSLLLLLFCRNTFTPATFSPTHFPLPVLCFGTYSCSQTAPWVFTGPAGVVGQKIHGWYFLHIDQGHYTAYASCLLTFFLNGREADKAARRGLTKSQVNCVIPLGKKKTTTNVELQCNNDLKLSNCDYILIRFVTYQDCIRHQNTEKEVRYDPFTVIYKYF